MKRSCVLVSLVPIIIASIIITKMQEFTFVTANIKLFPEIKQHRDFCGGCNSVIYPDITDT